MFLCILRNGVANRDVRDKAWLLASRGHGPITYNTLLANYIEHTINII